jgi:HK97 gp10 family phage protein
MNFNGLLHFGQFLAALPAAVEHETTKALEKAAKIVEHAAKDAIGDPNNAYGWPPLAQSTIDKHGDTPLLDTGELKASIKHEIEGHTAYVGTTLDKGLYHELGTSHVPPRPFLVPSVEHNKEEILHEIGHHVHGFLTN